MGILLDILTDFILFKNSIKPNIQLNTFIATASLLCSRKLHDSFSLQRHENKYNELSYT